MKGHVYILSNPSMPRLIKIGYTSKKTVEERAAELNTTGVPEDYKVEYFQRVKNAEKVEKELHKKFKHKRRNENREFFEVSVNEAISALKAYPVFTTAEEKRRDEDKAWELHKREEQIQALKEEYADVWGSLDEFRLNQNIYSHNLDAIKRLCIDKREEVKSRSRTPEEREHFKYEMERRYVRGMYHPMLMMVVFFIVLVIAQVSLFEMDKFTMLVVVNISFLGSAFLSMVTLSILEKKYYAEQEKEYEDILGTLSRMDDSEKYSEKEK